MTLTKRCRCSRDLRCDHPWWFKFKLHGAVYRGTTKTANKNLAARIADRERVDALEGRYGLRRVKVEPAPTVAEFMPTYLEWARQDHPATADLKDARVLAEFSEVVKSKRLDRVATFDIERWRSVRAKTVSRSTVNRELNVIKGFFSKAVEWGKLKTSPVTVEKYKTDDSRVRVLSTEELRQIADSGGDLALICRVTLVTLARLSEVLGLRREHLGPSWIEIRRKGGRVARVPVPAALLEALRARLDPTTGWVFGPRPWTQAAASVAYTRLFRRLRIDGASHHTLRHTGVTRMLEAGVNPRVIQRLAGWTTLRMLERYGHTADAEEWRAVEAMEAAWAGSAVKRAPPCAPAASSENSHESAAPA